MSTLIKDIGNVRYRKNMGAVENTLTLVEQSLIHAIVVKAKLRSKRS